MLVVLKELDALRLDVKVADTSLTLTRSEDGLDMERCKLYGRDNNVYLYS